MVTFNKDVKTFYYNLSEEERSFKKLMFQATNLLLSLYKDELKEQGYLSEDLEDDFFNEEFSFEEAFQEHVQCGRFRVIYN